MSVARRVDARVVVEPGTGRRWATSTAVCERAGIPRARLDVWVHRGLVARPRRAGGVGWYDLDEVLDVEARAGGRHAGSGAVQDAGREVA